MKLTVVIDKAIGDGLKLKIEAVSTIIIEENNTYQIYPAKGKLKDLLEMLVNNKIEYSLVQIE